MSTRPRAKQTAWRLVLKLGGELLEQPQDVERVAGAIARLAKRSSMVVVHGGGKEIDAALVQTASLRLVPLGHNSKHDPRIAPGQPIDDGGDEARRL